MTINTRENREKRDAFFEKLNALISEFPELTEADVHHEDCDCGFNPDSPIIVTGIIVGVTIRNTDDFEQIFWTTPYGQSHFLTKGIINAIGEMV